MTNPYAVTASTEPERGVFGDHARLLRGGFLYRSIAVDRPVATELVYSGWWWTQTLHVDGVCVWRRISWKTFHPSAEFQVVDERSGREWSGRIEIDFSQTLAIRRFRVWIENELVYDEVNAG